MCKNNCLVPQHGRVGTCRSSKLGECRTQEGAANLLLPVGRPKPRGRKGPAQGLYKSAGMQSCTLTSFCSVSINSTPSGTLDGHSIGGLLRTAFALEEKGKQMNHT